ncbi:MAG: SH3 domain-containing protein [Betaproteobacteria bacterium]|mgnify:CR=1 FL=1|nr:SH3 domain-containing protein [Betaproteobacteria bacterium]
MAAVAQALEFRAIGETPAVLYDGPSTKATKILVISAGTPVEILSSIEGWAKIREPGGKLAWAESSGLASRRNVVVLASPAVARNAPEESAPAVFEAQRGVILELLEQNGAWARVKHRDGPAGYLRAVELWGL